MQCYKKEGSVEGFAECFTEAQKSSVAMQHFLPKCNSSSAASSRPKHPPTQQTAKPMPATPEPQPLNDRQHSSRSARRYPITKRQGPRTKIALDPVPQKSSWSARQKDEGPESRHRQITPQAVFNVPLVTPLSTRCRGNCVIGSPRAHFSVRQRPTTVLVDKIKHIYFQTFNSIQDYLHSAFYDTIVAKQLHRKLSF